MAPYHIISRTRADSQSETAPVKELFNFIFFSVAYMYNKRIFIRKAAQVTFCRCCFCVVY